MTRTTPLERLLAIINDQDPASRSIALLSAAEIEALSVKVRSVLQELAIAELADGSTARLAPYGMREGALFSLQIAGAIQVLPSLGAALKADPKDLNALADLLIQLASLERGLALCHEGADTALLHAVDVANGYVKATLEAVQTRLASEVVTDAVRAQLIAPAAALDEATRLAERGAGAAADGGAARGEVDEAQDIKDFVAAVRGGKVATLALPGKADAAKRKKVDTGKARGARSLQ